MTPWTNHDKSFELDADFQKCLLLLVEGGNECDGFFSEVSWVRMPTPYLSSDAFEALPKGLTMGNKRCLGNAFCFLDDHMLHDVACLLYNPANSFSQIDMRSKLERRTVLQWETASCARSKLRPCRSLEPPKWRQERGASGLLKQPIAVRSVSVRTP